MRRFLTIRISLIAVVLGLGILAASARAQSPTGQISGRITDAQGAALGAITVAAAPVGNTDQVTLTNTDAAGNYVLTLAPGSYYVAFNALSPVDDRFGSVYFGGPGPSPGAVCTVCGGRPIPVAAGAATPEISAALTSPPFPQTGFLRPLSGVAIRLIGGRLRFKVGCHIEPTGCMATARLRLGHSLAGPTIATAKLVLAPGTLGEFVFVVPPAAIAARVRATRHRALPAVVEITAPPSHTVTRFVLVAR